MSRILFSELFRRAAAEVLKRSPDADVQHDISYALTSCRASAAISSSPVH